MIVVKLQGGLGNQMFQYAIGRKLSLLRNTYLKLDIFHYFEEQTEEKTLRNFELKLFNINAEIANKNDILIARGQNKITPYRKLFNLNERYKPYYKQQTIIEKNQNFDADIAKCKSNCYLKGFWQTEKYFSDIRPILLEDFKFRIQPDHTNSEIIKKINASNSVSIHLRRGDYVTNKHYNNVHFVLDKEYIYTAISYIKSKIEKPFFFFFSDDLDYVKANFSNCENTFQVDVNTKAAYNDMRLMSLCKHNIIANSSFSWWGAWLNSNPDKIVIAPEKWYKTDNIKTDDLIPGTWIKL